MPDGADPLRRFRRLVDGDRNAGARRMASPSRCSARWEPPPGPTSSQSRPRPSRASATSSNVPPGFQVERLFTVPRETLGSWVSIAFDNKGRLIASDQEKLGLCRITPPPIGSDEPTKVEHLDVKITSAQGLLYAFDSLYLSVNGGPGSGLYRATRHRRRRPVRQGREARDVPRRRRARPARPAAHARRQVDL